MLNKLSQNITSHQAYKISHLKEVMMIDTRNDEQIYKTGIPKGALRCEYDPDIKVFFEKLASLNPEDKYVVFFLENTNKNIESSEPKKFIRGALVEDNTNETEDIIKSLASIFPDKSKKFFRVIDGVEGNDRGFGWIANGYPVGFEEIEQKEED